jgi:hypothetical protein
MATSTGQALNWCHLRLGYCAEFCTNLLVLGFVSRIERWHGITVRGEISTE